MKKKNIISIIFLSIILFLIVGLALKQKENNYIKETNDSEVTFAYVVDGVKQNTIPSKEGYTFDTENSSCTNGVTISWNYSNWNAKISNLKNTKSNCTLYFKKEYAEGILNGAIPEIKGDLVPVTIDNNGVVRKADLSSEWYSYQNKRWANAVILIDKTKEYKNNEEIKEENIESYFVWIPRYRYQIFSNGNYTGTTDLKEIEDSTTVSQINQQKEIKLEFESKETSISNDTTVGKYYTHPAFINFNSNGMWVGKFETGYNQNENTSNLINDKSGWSKEGAEQNIKDSSKIIIKPNVYSWRSINVSNAFYTSYEYMRDLESHMMKNTEWGAIAYLTNSQYGRCNDSSCTEPRFNNNGNYVTGYSANFDPTCGYTGTNETCNKYEFVGLNLNGSVGWNYYNSSSVVASTTGNYYGIYDMAGSAREYVMGVMKSSDTNSTPASGSSSSANSGFKGPYSNEQGTNNTGYDWPSSKYYDLYEYAINEKQYQRGHLGDATKELGPFFSVIYTPGGKNNTRYVSSYFSDDSYFVGSGAPWFIRGGDYEDGSATGVGGFMYWSGVGHNGMTFRIVLTP